MVCSVSVGGAGRLNVRLSPKKYTSAMSVGITSAENFSQYWNACTNVTERMPPTSTVTTTTTAAATEPSVYGSPVAVVSVSPAPWSWGSR